jgi:hypothetical protein
LEDGNFDSTIKDWDNMKQPAAILVLKYWYTILVIPVLQILEDSGKYWLYQYCRYWKIR